MQFKIHRLKTTPGTDGDSDPVRQRLKSSGAPAQFLTVDVIVREFLNFSLYRGPMPRREKESLLFQFRVNSGCGSNELIVLPANNSTSVRQVTRRHWDLRSLIFPSQSWNPLYFNPPKKKNTPLLPLPPISDPLRLLSTCRTCRTPVRNLRFRRHGDGRAAANALAGCIHDPATQRPGGFESRIRPAL